jgi:hypothetical protein
LAEISDAELELILDALEDATIYRDARSRVVDGAVRRHARRTGASPANQTGGDADRDKVRAYSELALKLKAERAPRR